VGLLRRAPAFWLAALFFLAPAWLSCPAPALPQVEAPRPGQEDFLESFFKNKDLYDQAFARAGPAVASGVRAGIVPHHFLARDLIAAFFQGLASPGVPQVFLVGPDHFRSLSGTGLLFATTLLPWRTPFGALEPDRELLKQLLAGNDAPVRDRAFRREHSIWVLTPFVRRAFPRARLIPLVLRDSKDYQRFRELGAVLARLADPGALLVVSSDFCHGGSEEDAARLDATSLALLDSLAPNDIARINCDCRPCLAVLDGFLGPGSRDFTLLRRQTSRDLGAPPGQSLTSYVSGYFRSPPPAAARVLFVGDLFLDRHIRKVAQERGYDYLLREVKGLLQASDLVVANLEGPITRAPSVCQGRRSWEPEHYRFTFAPAAAKTLAEHHIKLVHLGNNHALDFGSRGLAETKEHLTAAGISCFGAPKTPEERSLVKDIGGLKWGFVSFNQFADADEASTLKEIQRLKAEAGVVVVYTHWGAEYTHTPGPRVRQWARAFIDSGADLVIGSHPHVVQEKEEHRGKMIYYSLGNFVFDQYRRRDTTRGLAVRATVENPQGRLMLEEIPLVLERRGQTVAESGQR
jgi:poly-gamma-glutamate synthesis protein (capsule biosynthesis protein)